MSEDLVVHPVTGEQLHLADQPAGDLLHILDILRERAAQMKQWADAVEDELVGRGADPGLYDINEAWAREWDPDDLMLALSDLVQRGRLSLAETSGILVSQPPKVNGTKAKALLDRADEDVMVELRRCFTWKKKGRTRVQAVRQQVELEP